MQFMLKTGSMVNVNAIKGGLIVFGLTALSSMTVSIFLEITSPAYFCSVTGKDGGNCAFTLTLFMLAVIFMIVFCIGSLLWVTFTRYKKITDEA